jgi:hypothetical protein
MPVLFQRHPAQRLLAISTTSVLQIDFLLGCKMLVQMNFRNYALDLMRDGDKWFARLRRLDGEKIRIRERKFDHVDTLSYHAADHAIAEARQIIEGTI